MAIKVNGTTVIDNSRNVQNVGGFRTVNGTSVVGSGNISAGASTTADAVGTYTWGRPANSTAYSIGQTASGIQPTGQNRSIGDSAYWDNGWQNNGSTGPTRSGTWRCMSPAWIWSTGQNISHAGLWVRIS